MTKQMPPKKNRFAYINIRISAETHKHLATFSRKGETWDDVVKRLMYGVEHVNFELVSIDEKPPTGYRVTYVIGNAKYVYQNGKYALAGVA